MRSVRGDRAAGVRRRRKWGITERGVVEIPLLYSFPPPHTDVPLLPKRTPCTALVNYGGLGDLRRSPYGKLSFSFFSSASCPPHTSVDSRNPTPVILTRQRRPSFAGTALSYPLNRPFTFRLIIRWGPRDMGHPLIRRSLA